MVMKNDDGAASVTHFSMPDFQGLRQPDFLKRDVPLFKEKLVLSDEQVAALERQLDAYLEAFEKLKKEQLQITEPGPIIFGKPEMANGDGMPGGDIVFSPKNLDDLPNTNLDDLDDMADFDGEMPAGVGLSVRVTADAPGGEDAPAAGGGEGPEPDVAISFSGPNGQELPEEVRKALEKRAAEMVAQIKQQLQQRLAEGQQPADAAGGAAAAAVPGLGDLNIDELKQRQEDMAKQAASFRKAKEELRQKFVTEAQAPLATPQVEHWPALERALLREKSLPKGRISGERTDLFKMLKSTGLDQSQSAVLAEQLDAYELALDSALRQRNDSLDDATAKIDRAMQEQNPDKALSIVDHVTALRMAIRATNQQFADSIAAILSADKAQVFQNAVLRATYPQVYRTTIGQKTFAAAAKIDGLDDQTRAGLKSLESAYRAELEQVNQQLRRAIDKNQPLEPRRKFENMKQMMQGNAGKDVLFDENEKDPIADAFTKRRELDARYAKSVAEMLTPEQAAQLPKQPTRKAGQPIIIRSLAGS